MTANPATPEDGRTSSLPLEVHQQLGHLTRQLHDALNELGYVDRLQGTVQSLPDAKSRLSYIARLTGEAAEKVLNSVDQAKQEQAQVAADTRAIAQSIVADPVAAVAKGHVMNFVEGVERATERIDRHLTDIMLAQDFHDLTGQVINKVVKLASDIEEQLADLLVQTTPAEQRHKVENGWLNGPVVDPQARTDVVKGQQDVDDLLASLGF